MKNLGIGLAVAMMCLGAACTSAPDTLGDDVAQDGDKLGETQQAIVWPPCGQTTSATGCPAGYTRVGNQCHKYGVTACAAGSTMAIDYSPNGSPSTVDFCLNNGHPVNGTWCTNGAAPYRQNGLDSCYITYGTPTCLAGYVYQSDWTCVANPGYCCQGGGYCSNNASKCCSTSSQCPGGSCVVP